MIDNQERITQIDVESQMKQAYIDYSMSVIVSRALPDVRDGFKPVHRRVLYAMNSINCTNDKPHKKCATIVGEVMGKYHPHGDSSIYGTLVRLGQSWSLRYPLVDPQGNFGSVDGDSPAAMRYTEARMSKIADEMLKDIEKNTVNFVPNFSETTSEPLVLPTRLPNLLINGSSGIAVGMATNMAPHNLLETIDAIVAYIDNNDITIPELMKYILAPDFPTGGYIYGYSGVKEAYETGRGKVIIRSKAEIEAAQTSSDYDKIVITEIPYMVNKAELIKSIADLAIDNKVQGIYNVNDETDRQGMRIVVDVKKDANASVVLNQLFKYTALQTSFNINNIALVDGRPRTLNLKELIHYFVEHRHEVVTRRTEFELDKAKERMEVLEGCIIILDNLDEAIAIIRASKTPSEAKENLMVRFGITDRQATYISELRLRQLTSMEQNKLREEYEELLKKIEDLKDILARYERKMEIIKNELIEIREKYGDERKTQIIYSSEEFNPEDFYADDEMVITISHLGYIKRTPLAEYKAQNRGGIGAIGGKTRDEDFIEYIYPASMHATMLFFTQKGRCYWLKVYEIPEGNKQSKGRAMQNLLNIGSDDKINAFIRVKQLQDEEFNTSHNLIFCTKQGVVKKTALEAYSRPRQNGVNAITIREDDQVIQVRLTNGDDEIILASKNGKAIRFNEQTVRVMGRNATGVKGMTLEDELDEVVGMIAVPKDSTDSVLVISELGNGKRSLLEDYRITNRGGKGVKTINITEKTGKLVAIKSVNDDNDIMIIKKSGVTIRIHAKDIKVIGRATQGVNLITLKDGDQIASVCKVIAEEEDMIDNINESNETGIDTEKTES